MGESVEEFKVGDLVVTQAADSEVIVWTIDKVFKAATGQVFLSVFRGNRMIDGYETKHLDAKGCIKVALVN